MSAILKTQGSLFLCMLLLNIDISSISRNSFAVVVIVLFWTFLYYGLKFRSRRKYLKFTTLNEASVFLCNFKKMSMTTGRSFPEICVYVMH
jgi:hypothetical protein